MRAPTTDAHRPPRPQPTHATHPALPSPPPRRQPLPTARRRAPEPAAAQRGLDRRAVHAYRQQRVHSYAPRRPFRVSQDTRKGRRLHTRRPHPGVAHDRTQGTNQNRPDPPPRSSHRDAVILTQAGGQHLIQELDVDRVLVQTNPDGIVTEPRWARSSMLSGTPEADMVRHGPTDGA